MKYIVSVAVDGRVDVEVEANSFEEAKEKASNEVCEINFGNLECIDWHAVNAEDEKILFVKQFKYLFEVIENAIVNSS